MHSMHVQKNTYIVSPYVYRTHTRRRHAYHTSSKKYIYSVTVRKYIQCTHACACTLHISAFPVSMPTICITSHVHSPALLDRINTSSTGMYVLTYVIMYVSSYGRSLFQDISPPTRERRGGCACCGTLSLASHHGSITVCV